MKVTTETLSQAFSDYLKGDTRFPLLHKPFQKIDGIRVSDLAVCSARWAAQRLKIAPTHEHLMEHSINTLMKFEQGRRWGEVWQEALHDHFGEEFDHEVELSATVAGVTLLGHADGVIAGKYPVEIKNTNYREPQTHHLVQLWSYMYMLNAETGWLIFQRQDEQQIFQIDGFEANAVVDAVREKQEMLDFAAAKSTLPPRPLHSVMPYHCVVEKKDRVVPGVRRSGTVTPACPFFGHCYGLKESFYETTYDEGGNLTVVATI